MKLKREKAVLSPLKRDTGANIRGQAGKVPARTPESGAASPHGAAGLQNAVLLTTSNEDLPSRRLRREESVAFVLLHARLRRASGSSTPSGRASFDLRNLEWSS